MEHGFARGMEKHCIRRAVMDIVQSLTGTILALWCLSAVSHAQAPPPPDGQGAHPLPAEEIRLSPAIFREGLKKRGLTELLEQHLREYPPLSPSSAVLMQREVKLAEFADRNRPQAERRAAIAEANRLLEQIIADNEDDQRALEWRMMLAHSLVYEEGEPFAINLLYFGGTLEDRQNLAPLTARALAATSDLLARIDRENERIDGIDAAEFERLEKSGLVEKLDQLRPAGQYLQLWAFFYDALPRENNDPMRARHLGAIVRTFSENTDWLTTPQSVSRVQIPALLLAGMTQRRLENHASAREHFDRLVVAADKLVDEAEKDGLYWAIALAALEAARNARDEGRFDVGLEHLTRLRAMPAVKHSHQYGIRLAAALVERSILMAQAESAEKAGRSSDARKMRENAWRVLATLAGEEPDQRDQMYSVLYHTAGGSSNVAGVRDPVEMCALLAGLLADAAKDDGKKEPLLRRAIQEGEVFLSQASGAQRSVAPEILFQMGVAHYRLGENVPAAQKLIEIARRHPNSGQAADAAVMAVQLAALQCQAEGSCPKGSPGEQLFRSVLEIFLGAFPDLQSGRYWRFYYAQLLENSEEYEAAAAEYARVDREHEHYLEAGFRRVRALARGVSRRFARESTATADAVAMIDTLTNAQREFMVRAAGERRSNDEERSRRIDELLAESRILLGETYLLAAVTRPEQALEVIADIERTGSVGLLLGRAWRVRLRALQIMERFEEAARVVPDYVAADPQNAGPTLQALFQSMLAEAKRTPPDDATQAGANAEMLVLISSEIVKWSQNEAVQATPAQKREAAVQHAEAQLFAGNFAEARGLFAALRPKATVEPARMDATDLRAVVGHAEALLRSGDAATALPEFNRVAANLPPEHPMRWMALVGDLEARTTLGQPSDGILRVIAQQRRLFPQLGGPEIAARIERLERENTRRRDEGKKP